MKKYFLTVLLFLSVLKAQTVIVDENAICTRAGCYGACKSGDYVVNTISDAVSLANSNNNITTIEICAGEYDENRIQIKRGNLTVTSASGKRDVSIVSNSNNNIFYTRSYYSNLTFSHLTLDQKKNRSDFYFYEGDGYTFDDLNMTSARYAIYFKRNAQNVVINNSIVNTGSYGIYFKKSVWNDVNLSDVNITTSDYDALRFNSDAGNLNIKNTDINTTNGGDYGIYVNGNISVINFSNLTVNSNKDALHIEKSVYKPFIINNSTFNSGSSYSGINFQGDIDNGGSLDSVSIQAGYRGVNFDSNAYGDINISDSNISADSDTAIRLGGSGGDFNVTGSQINSTNGYGLYFSGAIDKIDFENNKVVAYNDGLHFDGNINSGTVFKHNCMKSYNDYALNFQGHVYNPVTVENNCFYADSGTSYLAYSKYDVINADQNYWDGVNGAYNQNNFVDNNPWSECQNSCAITNALPTPIINYKMDECSWDNDTTTYEINNSGSLGSEYNATAGNDANVTEGKICNGGDINSTDTEDKYVIPKTEIPLPNSYTLNLWVKFPLSLQGHKAFVSTSNSGGGGWFRLFNSISSTSTTYYYFNIADRPGSNYDYIYFAYDETDNEWSLCVTDDNTYDCQSFDPNSYNGWHMLTFNVDSDNQQTVFYMDAEKKLTFSAYPTGKLGLLFNSDYESTNTNQPNGQSIGSDVDEFEIYNGLLSDAEIQDLYNNQNASSRVCPICNANSNQEINSTFNAIDYIDLSQCDAQNDWDNNITTKIVNKDFNLTILAKDKNTGANTLAQINRVDLYVYATNDCSGNYKTYTVCDDTTSNKCDINTTANGCATLKDVVYQSAAKCVKVHIVGKALTTDPTQTANEDESNSTDDFALRPEKFVIMYIPSKVRAGKEFNITIQAQDANGNPAKDYNETVYIRGNSVDLDYNDTNASKGCITGVLDKVSGGNFVNGEANLTLKYSEVGDVNFTLKEINGSEFAKVDENDTPDSQRFIAQTYKTVEFTVDHFDVNATVNNYDTENNFTYLDNDLNISAVMDINITAKNAENGVTKNYNDKCYAKDVNVTIAKDYKYNNTEINVTKLRYIISDVNENNSSLQEINKDDNISFTYTEGNFTTDNNGSTHLTLYINFDRNFSVPSNPFEMNITDINVNNEDTNADNVNLPQKSVTFYYGNLMLNNIITTSDIVSKTGYFEMYDENSSDSLIPSGAKELLFNWYHNLYHNLKDGNVSSGEIKVTNDYNASSQALNVDVSVDVKDGNITFNVKRNSTDITFAVVHLLSPELKWLWFSKFGDAYDISSNSTCLHHFCFTVTWQNTNEAGEIGSGEFNGTEANVTETNTSKVGVKIFR